MVPNQMPSGVKHRVMGNLYTGVLFNDRNRYPLRALLCLG